MRRVCMCGSVWFRWCGRACMLISLRVVQLGLFFFWLCEG